MSRSGFTKKVFNFVAAAGAFVPLTAHADFSPAPWSKETLLEVVKKAPKDAPQPKAGELVSIRFKGMYNGNAFDDTFSTENSYLYRTGVGLIVKGLDDTVVNMQVGDRYKVKFDGDLSFEKGLKSSPGKPRIPPRAPVEYEVELMDLPGKGDEFILDDPIDNSSSD